MHKLVAFGAALLIANSALGDITIRDYSDATNDRFTNDASFVLDGFDLSGVGQATSGKWATAISRNVVVSAFHYAPAGEVHFYPGNDPLSSPVVRNIQSGMRIPETDLYLGLLDSPLPSSITHYGYATLDLVGTAGVNAPFPVDDAGIFQGMNAYMFGRSPVAHATITQDQAVGRNLITGYSENYAFNGDDNDMLILEFENIGDPDARLYEARFQGGDSGGPTFVEMGGQLQLLGTNAIIYLDGEFETPGIGSGINYIGNQTLFVDSFVTANAVPEPSFLTVLAGMTTVLSFRRRRA